MNLGLITVHYHQMKKAQLPPNPHIATTKTTPLKEETVIKGIQKEIFSPLTVYLETHESTLKIIDALYQKAIELKLVTTNDSKSYSQIELQEKFKRINFNLSFGTIEERKEVNKLTLEVADALKFAIEVNKKPKSSCVIQ